MAQEVKITLQTYKKIWKGRDNYNVAGLKRTLNVTYIPLLPSHLMNSSNFLFLFFFHYFQLSKLKSWQWLDYLMFKNTWFCQYMYTYIVWKHMHYTCIWKLHVNLYLHVSLNHVLEKFLLNKNYFLLISSLL